MTTATPTKHLTRARYLAGDDLFGRWQADVRSGAGPAMQFEQSKTKLIKTFLEK